MNAVLCSINFTRLSFALKDTLRLHNFRRSSTVKATAPVARGYARFHRNAIPEEIEPLTSYSSGDGSFQLETQLLLHDLDGAVNLIPEKFRAIVLDHEEHQELIELVLDYGRPLLARFPSGDFELSEELINDKDLEDAVEAVGGFDDSNRAGLEGTLHRISCIRDRDLRIYGLTIRIGRAVTTETAELVKEPLSKGQSILLIGPPGVGKTSAIRNFCKMLSETCKKRVMIVDTSGEIAGPGRVPHRAVGKCRRMQVRRRSDQHNVMIEAVQNHMPEVIVIDEIGESEDLLFQQVVLFVKAEERSVMQEDPSLRGGPIVSHYAWYVRGGHNIFYHPCLGRSLEEMVKDRVLRELVGGVGDVILGDDRASKMKTDKKITQERIDASSFDVVVEMAGRTRWRIHYDANKAVDAILADCSPEAEIHFLDENGNMVVRKEREEKLQRALEEARRILKSSSDFSILQIEKGASYEELCECFHAIHIEMLEAANESETVEKARNRLCQAFDYLRFHCSNNIVVDVRDKMHEEASRIWNARFDFEVLQTAIGSTRSELRRRYIIVFQRILETEKEDEAVRLARHRLYLAYQKLLRDYDHEEADILDHDEA